MEYFHEKGAILAKGTFGIIYEIKHTPYVMKEVRDDDDDACLFDEVLFLLELSGSPNVIELLDYNLSRDGKRLRMLYDRYDCSLSDCLKNQDMKLPVSSLISQIATGIRACHRHRIVHGDIKPDNILIRCSSPEDWDVVLCDFGCTFYTSQENVGGLGTPGYRAPELCMRELFGFEKDTRVRFSSDIWAMGCVFAEIFMHSPVEFSPLDHHQVIEEFSTLTCVPPQHETARKYQRVRELIREHEWMDEGVWAQMISSAYFRRPTSRRVLVECRN